MKNNLVLSLRCPDRPGIVHAVSGFLFRNDCNIIDSDQFGDEGSGTFFMRVHFTGNSLDFLREEFKAIVSEFSMDFGFYDLNKKPRTAILVSSEGHCLNDLLFRESTESLPIDTVAVISNSEALKSMAESYGKPFHYYPVGDDYDNQEKLIREKLVELDLETVILARYMRILKPETCALFKGKIINIHHSFLPSFKGARPYHRAYETGVKLIGATAHYVTSDLDEGPIIEQDVERVDHSLSASDLRRVGKDVESQTLARAVLWHAERRILINANRTVVFR